MINEEKLSALIGQIYDAAGDMSQWPVFLTAFSDAVQGENATILFHDMTVLRGTAAVSVRTDPNCEKMYNERFGRVDPWREAWLKRFSGAGANGITTGEEVISNTELQKTEFYNDFLVPNRIGHQFCGPIHVESDWSAVISCLRSARRGPFGVEAKGLLRLLLPHLQRAAQFQRRLSVLFAGEEILNTFTNGIVFISAASRILFVNRAAEEILRSRDGLESRADKLRAQHSGSEASLKAAIEGALAPGRIQAYPNTALLRRHSGLRPYQAIVFPVQSRFNRFIGGSAVAAAILITDPEKEVQTDESLLMQLLSLTRSESRVASLLVKGLSTAEIAGQMEIQENTVRAHLKSLFAKTGTRGQADLVRLLLTSCARRGL